MKKLLFYIINIWHCYVWIPLMAKLNKSAYGKPIVNIFRLFYGSLVILGALAPPQGAIPCLIHAFYRSNDSKFLKKPFRAKITQLFKFWRS